MCTHMMNHSQTSPSHSMSPYNQQTTLARLLSQRQWSLLDSVLSSTTSASSILIDDPNLPHAITSDIVIHFAARFQAPLRIISLLARIYPSSLASADITGRYPIHVAGKWAATPDVIAYLIKTNPTVAGVPDSTGKTPMHYVGECYIRHFDNPMYNRDDSMLQVVRLLKNAAPNSVNLEDNEGMNAIEYALESDTNLKVVKTMQRACRDDWRERSKSCNTIMQDQGSPGADHTIAVAQKPPQLVGRRRHQDLVKDMECMATKLQHQYCSERSMGSRKLTHDRVHMHRSKSAANTQAARTA